MLRPYAEGLQEMVVASWPQSISEVSRFMGYPHSWMVFEWENFTKMDDEQGYPYFRKPPNGFVLFVEIRSPHEMPNLRLGSAGDAREHFENQLHWETVAPS